MTNRRALLLATRCLVLFALCALPFAARAQTANATLSGTVEDQKGGVVPGVQITLTNTATTLERQVVTSESGSFVLPLVPPGKYRLTAQREGFMSAQIPDLVLNVGDQKTLQIQLKVGDVKEVVNITSEAPLINESPAVGTVVDRQFVANMPLNGRSFQSLISLTPGVVSVPVPGGTILGQFSVNGQRSDANYFMVDGVSANIGTFPGSQAQPGVGGNLPGLTAQGTTQSLVSVDAMQEFRVQTSTYSAEYGRQPGGQISIVTRAGTNAFHGSLFDYVRNDIFDANDWFGNANRQSRPPERQNDFGGTFSGPLLLPRFGEGGHQPGYNGRNRTFFFFSYEGLQLRQPQFTLINVPTLCLRGRGSCPAGQSAGAAALQPILNAFPLPNGRDLGNGLAEFTASYSTPSSLNATSIRVDHTLNSKVTVFGRYNIAPSRTETRNTGNLAIIGLSSLKAQTLTLGVMSTLSSRFNNDLRLNYSRNSTVFSSAQEGFGGSIPVARGALIPSQYDSKYAQGTVFPNFPGRTASAAPRVFVAGDVLSIQHQFNIVDSFAYSVGSHQVKLGFDYRSLTPLFAGNAYTVSSTFANQQEVINGIASSGNLSSFSIINPIYANFSVYAQDTWKFSRRLILDFGLRWDVNPSPSEANGNDPLAVNQVTNLATMQLAQHGTKQWQTTYNNFAPRVGAAYQLVQRPGRETVLRGGFGLFYDTGNNLASAGYISYPFVLSRSLTNVFYPYNPTQVAPPPQLDLSNLLPPYGTIAVFDPNLKLPYTLQWNLAVQQSLGKNQALTVSYVGAAGRRLLQQRQITLSSSAVHINPSFTIIQLTTNNATSDYNALQAQYQRRLSRGLQALVSYTWSHALDFDSADNGTIIPVRGNSDYDVRHNFAAALTYDIPTLSQARLLKAVLGGWAVDSRINARSAFPVDIRGTQVVNPADGTLVAARANVVVGVPLYIYDSSLPGGKKINRAAFSIPATGAFGNLGRNVVRGLGAWQVDLAIRRQFNLTEKLKLQFRGEAFNLFNHPNFGAIQTSLTAANFGQATNMLNRQLGGISQLYQIGGPRSFQFAIKALF